MLTPFGHLTYCTNIHGGETWPDHFAALKASFPLIKEQVAPSQSLGIGLRLSDRASRNLKDPATLATFKNWLSSQDAYVFTMNGFPFGAFHDDVVKANVHAPDWTADARVAYTLRMFDILADLIPEGMDGGISTSPLAYRHWYTATVGQWEAMRKQATQHIVHIAEHLIVVQRDQGKCLHLDIEPEPDGVLESGPEFMAWFEEELIPEGKKNLVKHLGLTEAEAEQALKRHIRICYDVCHFALGYEDHAAVIAELGQRGIQIGKIQISAAVGAAMPPDDTGRQAIGNAFMAFDEPTYLHQVLARRHDGSVLRFRDLPEAKVCLNDSQVAEWRAHFHVPVFFEDLGLLKSTQADISRVLELQRGRSLTQHLEVETYTWGVLPKSLQLPLAGSISRELTWVLEKLNSA